MNERLPFRPRCLSDGHALKVFTVMEEFIREELALDVDTTMPASKIIVVLARLFRAHGAP